MEFNRKFSVWYVANLKAKTLLFSLPDETKSDQIRDSSDLTSQHVMNYKVISLLIHNVQEFPLKLDGERVLVFDVSSFHYNIRNFVNQYWKTLSWNFGIWVVVFK